MIKIAFDVDGTLIRKSPKGEDVPRLEILLYLSFYHIVGDCEIFVWSGSGIEYANRWVEKLGLQDVTVVAKGSFIPDIAVDDEEVTLGKVNLKV